MEKQQIVNEILSRLRDATKEPSAPRIGTVVRHALDGLPLGDVSDEHLLMLLRKRAYFSMKVPLTRHITVELLAAMDDAGQQESASSYNWLRSQVQKLYEISRSGGPLTIESEPTLHLTAEEFKSWANQRYQAL